MQPSLYFLAEGEEPRPLLVGLHTWSHNRTNQIQYLLKFAEEQNFNMLLPEFRGPNLMSNPNKEQTCGSLLAKQDIKDAIDFIKATKRIDSTNIFLVGLSGGGHMAMLMAGFCPEYFKAIGAYVPITDLKKWTEENPNYKPHVVACCGTEEEMLRRSPVSYIDTIARANLKIFHGKYDSCVPVTQSLELYRMVFENHPRARVFLDIFDGGHEIDMNEATYWLLSQYNEREKVKVTG